MIIREQMSIFAGGWLIICICGVIQWCLNPIFYDFYINIDNSRTINSTIYRHLPYPGTFPWNVDNFSKYLGTFTFQLIGGIGCAIGHSTFDILYTTLLACANLHLQILGDTLVDRDETTKIIIRNKLDIHKFYNKLKNCIVYHKTVLEFLDEFIRLSFWPMFIICFDTTVAVCLVSLEAATMKIDVIF
uniref:Olfactory receptor 111 n=1 Tax=Aulacocentrum confusum TaxID=2767324 RepID=A0A7G8Z9D0_9HYME|nr:olfactory receptor 111 [Aulacocentrum confusum]